MLDRLLHSQDVLQVLICLGLGAAFTFVAYAIIALGSRAWAVAVAFAIPVALIFLDGSYRDSNWHGFMHSGIVYGIFDGGSRPYEDPIMAGQPLRYPWLHHWLIAK